FYDTTSYVVLFYATCCCYYSCRSVPFSFYPGHQFPRSFPTRRSSDLGHIGPDEADALAEVVRESLAPVLGHVGDDDLGTRPHKRSEEHTSELQSRENLVCRLLLEKKK